MSLAPIGISVYTRISHFKQCIEALQKNILADQSELFIYSDAASKIEDEVLVKEVREYAHNITGFKKVHIIERTRNYGGTKNASQAIGEITKKYGKSIFMEDDIVTAPGFLKFMNDALEFYKDDESINSISGYMPMIELPTNYNKDIFILPVFSGWGTGMWQRSFNMKKDIAFNDFKQDVSKNKNFNSLMDTMIYGFLPAEIYKKIDAGDVKITYNQTLNGKYSIYPSETLVKNIGHDGSGVHCGVNQTYSNLKISNKLKFNFDSNIKINNDVLNEMKKLRSLTCLSKLKSMVKYPVYHFYLLWGKLNAK